MSGHATNPAATYRWVSALVGDGECHQSRVVVDLYGGFKQLLLQVAFRHSDLVQQGGGATGDRSLLANSSAV